ncbi:LacI family transcriptional regulator [Paenibacillus piri]|uniref:LacI family transcriptional regulator n=1 Tax=Paenibacillus piri TaxID=2547395 RepID=A0A4R5K7G7_9BACL|nr:LacI family transcriptional regulator [Paenibacillus piri]
MTRHSLSIFEGWNQETDTREDGIRKACSELLALNESERPTAIVAATDAIALECMNHLLYLGISVPEQISLCGIDNVNISAHHVNDSRK